MIDVTEVELRRSVRDARRATENLPKAVTPAARSIARALQLPRDVLHGSAKRTAVAYASTSTEPVVCAAPLNTVAVSRRQL